MQQVINSTNTENNEFWKKLINTFFSEDMDESDESFIYAGVWLSLNLFALDQELRFNLMERFKDPRQFPAIRILGAIEYLYEDDDRESEVILLMQLLQYAPNSHKQIDEVLFDPELSNYYKYSRMLLIDDEVFDDEYDDQNMDIGSDWDWNVELDDEHPDIPF